jgi:hypothetical protein
MVFQYPTRKGARADRWSPIIEKPPEQPQEILGLIQGKEPRSAEEWRVAVALTRFKVEFYYQVPIRGGTMLRGGQLLDFLLFIPNPLPLQVFGEYWHRAQMKNQDRWKLAILQQIYGVEPALLWGSELQTQEEANARVREVIGL